MKVQVGGLCIVDGDARIYRHSDSLDFVADVDLLTATLGIVLETRALENRPPWNTMCRVLLADGRTGWVRQTHLI